jgi:hypothetical protein
MPFEQILRHPFTSRDIRIYAPIASGVYGISNAREWIYIGVSDNIQGALLTHLREPRTLLMKREPSGFVFEICEGTRCAARQDRLVLEYEPAWNRRSSRYS